MRLPPGLTSSADTLRWSPTGSCGSHAATAPQCQALMDKHHIYLMLNGRISMAGLNTGNIDYVADAIHAVVTAAPRA